MEEDKELDESSSDGDEQLLKVVTYNNSTSHVSLQKLERKPSIKNSDELSRLLEAVIHNRETVIPNTIASMTEEQLQYRYKEHDSKTILIIACDEETVTAKTLSILYSSIKSTFGRVDCLDENWYGWEPIHYIARNSDHVKLRVLVDQMDDVNSLTYFSENALHILLEYEESVASFDVVLFCNPESKPGTIIGTEKRSIVKCAKILLDKGIDVNHRNFWNDSPICIAVRYRYVNTMELLLKIPYIDIDNSREMGKTIREFMKQHEICLSSLPQSTYFHEEPEAILFNFLKAGDEDCFIQFNNENIKDYVNAIDGESEDTTSGTMLQYCFRKGLLEYLQDDSSHSKSIGNNILETPMLRAFCTKGLKRCIEHLLDNGADLTKLTRTFKETLLEAAATRGYYPLVAILLQNRNSSIGVNEIFQVLPKIFQTEYKLANYKIYRNHVLCLLLNKLVAIYEHQLSLSKLPEIRISDKRRHILNVILHRLNLERDESCIDDTGNICQILNLGASLTGEDHCKRMVIQRLHIDTLTKHLDDCMKNNLFYYDSIVEDENNCYSEIKTLKYLIHDEAKCELLTHPLLAAFIRLKWMKVNWFFYLLLMFHACFVISIYVYMISSHTNSHNKYCDMVFYFLLSIHFAKEACQLLILYRWKYFHYQSNYFEFAVLVSCIITIFSPNVYSTATAVLFSSVICFMMIAEIPQFTKYTVIVGSIKYFLTYCCFYLIHFVSFAICFYIIFPLDKNQHGHDEDTASEIVSDITRNLFYTLIMFTGEFNERVLDPENYPVFGRVVMTVFIFCMTIILNNLLVGLIVADMDEIQKYGKLYKQMTAAGFITRTNSLIKLLQQLKWMDFIKVIIDKIHLFRKGKVKVLKASKRMKYVKGETYHKDVLKNVYEYIKNYEYKQKGDQMHFHNLFLK